MIYTVITTINGLTKPIEEFLTLPKFNNIIVIGDKGGIDIDSHIKGLQYYSYERQLSLNEFKSIDMPFHHYSRKNLGYLLAIRAGATEIFETDDDNFPYKEQSLSSFKNANRLVLELSELTSFNCYQLFSDEKIWPRGFPLHEVTKTQNFDISSEMVNADIVQGLADKDPDVDAIYRLTQASDEFKFSKGNSSYALPKGIYCPFNSQNTLWSHRVFALMYLPVTVSFRFTDILRSFVAKRCLDHMQKSLAFAPATVFQERNAHDLYKDFSDELECYQNTPHVLKSLSSMEMNEKNSPEEALLNCYQQLVYDKLVSDKELEYVHNWVDDLTAIQTELK
ncbi:STELLO glycosyltransferase family protein [Paraglaciecola sp. 2405UD69-4]|uniref:STELLO glycosyltransferase family protein n=1 Tax=Paraglaciecola sp. 2405UD69-4 TaxID=3391836 RepID=UPI0039C98CB6